MILRWLLLYSLLLIAWSDDPPQPLTWFGPVQPQKHKLQLEPDRRYTLELLLGDAPVATLHHRLPKYQLYQVDRLVEMTQWSLLGYNTNLQIQRFSNQQLTVHEGFHTRPNYQNEYHFQDHLTYAQCYMHCSARQSLIINSADQLKEVLDLVPRYDGHRWLHVSQISTPVGQNSFNYSLSFDNITLFPRNLLTEGTNYLYHFIDGEYKVLQQKLIRSRMLYWDPTSSSYYKGEPHHLLARIDGRGINIQILISLSSATHVPHFASAMCTCVRTVHKNLKDSQLALHMVSNTQSQLMNVPQDIEAVRVRRQSLVYQLSNVPSILENRQNPYTSGVNGFLESKDIFPLLSQEPQMTVLKSKTRQQELASSLIRSKRAASLGMALIAKAASFSAPYVLEKSAPLLTNLAKKLKAKFYSIPSSQNINISQNFQNFLNDKFNVSPATVQVLNDRLVLHVKNYPAGILSLAQPSTKQAQLVGLAANQLKTVRDIVIPQLPNLLIQNIIPTLPYPLKPNSKILVKVDKSLSFYVWRFYFEVVRNDLSFTNISSFSLPYKKEQRSLLKAQINQQLLNMNLLAKDDKGTKNEKDCVNKVLSSVPSNLLGSCSSEQFVPNLITSAFTLSHGDIKLLLGPGTLHLDCHHKSAEVVTLTYEYNLFYISHSCSFNLEHDHLHAHVRASSQDLNLFSAPLILGFNVPHFMSTRQQIIHWLIVISTIVALLAFIAIVLTLLFFYYKMKFKPKIFTKPSGEVELTLLKKQIEHHHFIESSQTSINLPLNTSYRPAPWKSAYPSHQNESEGELGATLIDAEIHNDESIKKKLCKPASH